ncbi:MAG: hypothetical protein ACRDI2_18885, partial [Chloroflexota bacterium]
IRDAQAYNPLLLRRAVDYFRQLNHGETDDHWLWITDFRSPLVDHLAASRILDAGAPWRLAVPLLTEGVLLASGGGETVVWQAALAQQAQPALRLHVVSYLGEATAVPDGTAAIEVQLIGAADAGDATEQTVTLRAGLETAEWAYGRPDVRASVQHRQAPVALQTRLVGAVSGAFTVNEYLATFDLAAPTAVREVRARSLIPGVKAYLQGLYVTPAEDSRFARASGGGSRANEALRPRAWIEGGQVEWLADQPERIVLRVTTLHRGTLVLADTYYPGWMATVDGVPSPLIPIEGLFRGVEVGPGRHEVTFRYRPGSLWIGWGLSAAGAIATCASVLLGRRRPPSRSPLDLR